MKKLILRLLIIASFLIITKIGNAQKRFSYEAKDGLVLSGTGLIFSLVAITCPDGSEWTRNKQGQNSQIVTKPWYTNPARDIYLGIGVTFSIGGLIYYHNTK